MESDIKYIETIGFRVYSDDLSKIPITDSKCKVINTISPNSYGIATNDVEFREALKSTDYLVLDGVYFALSSLMLQCKNIKRNQGPDVFYHFMKRSEKEKRSVFFLGSTEDTLNLIKTNAALLYPNVRVGTLSPPFKSEYSDDENIRIIDKINLFKPDILFIGMTCPKQEKWAVKNKYKLETNLIISIGNVFDWFAGTQKPIKPIWFKLRLGWLVRIIIRPEIFKRNIKNQLKFFWDLLLIFFKLKKYD